MQWSPDGVGDAVHDGVGDAVYDGVGDAVHDGVRDAVHDRVRLLAEHVHKLVHLQSRVWFRSEPNLVMDRGVDRYNRVQSELW